ncbi:MAG: [acyl-carrier-protein] S-malonyltransferase [Chloroflexi bacterium GWB2_49_20]|nr:MAG: [acyl-carrier-protein] S-malonyltransferase [Chloroflexi bacterium GWB2_49_20]OGN78948.1 MAG: [acyl-carrier-protein] S-malonyltransferase [Chloroflexi bacterium GWC2_49_37]OGN86291.1 MAG: [acyl-carrier-protein] S-malonyltransferase [Chloroflexi bacterium GWD2_49_16]HBG74518.1 [acyl-carrier-protein] S-malonyltransferase [Anaerolineae bacterium]
MKLNSENIAFIFPGQGSQIVGMGYDLANQFEVCRDIFNQADEILGFEFSKILWEGPSEALNDTVNTQPALFVHSYAALRLFENEFPDIKPTYIAGHSLGEISALVAAGAITFENGLKLVRKRGELMKDAGEKSPGGMAAVLGMDVNILEDICFQASDETGRVQIANDNCPGQIVISGDQSALERAIELAKTKGARKIRPLAVSIAAHSTLMNIAQLDFKNAIESIDKFKDVDVPVISNVTAMPMTHSGDLKLDLVAQLTSRVRWTESIKYIYSNGVSTFIEIGSGNVLTGLLKRINEDCNGYAFGTLDTIEAFRREMDVSTEM